MTRDKAIAAAARAANAAFRAFGGPREFTWLQCLGVEHELGRGVALADAIDADTEILPARLYYMAVAGDGRAKAYKDTPLALQVAVEVFLGAWLLLRLRVRASHAEELFARGRARRFEVVR